MPPLSKSLFIQRSHSRLNLGILHGIHHPGIDGSVSFLNHFHHHIRHDAAKNEQAKLYGRIAEIEDILSHAVIIEDENEATGRVGLGCTVVVEDANGKQITYRITGSQEANPMEYKLSDDSPFGRSIVGKAAGESFTVNAPAGSYTMKVVSVSREG